MVSLSNFLSKDVQCYINVNSPTFLSVEIYHNNKPYKKEYSCNDYIEITRTRKINKEGNAEWEEAKTQLSSYNFMVFIFTKREPLNVESLKEIIVLLTAAIEIKEQLDEVHRVNGPVEFDYMFLKRDIK